MFDRFFSGIRNASKRSFPLFEYLVLKTETHAFCGSLAFFSTLGFYPFCQLLLLFAKNILHWSSAYNVIVSALTEYYPAGQTFLVRNLEWSVAQSGSGIQPQSIFWVLLGSAGFFVPMEAAFNRLWNFKTDRPYWKNQLIGFLLTCACCILAVIFISLMALVYSSVSNIIFWDFLARALRYLALKISALCFSVAAIFLFYKFLPNGKVPSAQVLPAAMWVGVIAEVVQWVFALVLPYMQLPRSQGPYYVSISFALFAYCEAFVLLGGAFLASGAKKMPLGGTLGGGTK
ncbi:MAG TPA: YihY/virulence factor BrkB family protein [Acidobacteriota bacterium]|jgi:uncharacterized BrkB/YihY/UPF0761 family membrane protein